MLKAYLQVKQLIGTDFGVTLCRKVGRKWEEVGTWQEASHLAICYVPGEIETDMTFRLDAKCIGKVRRLLGE